MAASTTTNSSGSVVISSTTSTNIVAAGGFAFATGSKLEWLVTTVLAALAAALATAGNLIALCWVGMWMGITKPRHHRAILATLARVMLVPWAAIFILVLLTVGGGSLDFGSFMAFSLLWFGLAAVIESTFIARAKVGLHEAFRQISSDANPALTSAAWNAQALKLKLGEAA
jgi:hypothetical protein